MSDKNYFIDEGFETELGYKFDVGHELVDFKKFERECNNDSLIIDFYNKNFHEISEDKIDFFKDSENYLERSFLCYTVSVLKYVNLMDQYNDFTKIFKATSIVCKIWDPFKVRKIKRLENLSKKDIEDISLVYKIFKEKLDDNNLKISDKPGIFNAIKNCENKVEILSKAYDKNQSAKKIAYLKTREAKESFLYKDKLTARFACMPDQNDFDKNLFIDYIGKYWDMENKIDGMCKVFKSEISRNEKNILGINPYVATSTYFHPFTNRPLKN